MSLRIPDGLREATRLTRAGRLAEATALIQQTLRGPAGPDADAVRPTETASTAPRALPASLDALRLPAGQGGHAATSRPTSVFRPKPAALAGRFLDGVVSHAAGTRTYKLYVPSGYVGQAVPLVVLLHGCTQDATDFAAGTRLNEFSEEQTILVVYPEQARSANPSGCWNWFEPAHQERERGEPALIAGITRQIMRDYHVQPRRVYLAGLSAGGAMAVVMGIAYPDLYAAIGLHSGVAYRAAHDLRSALTAMRRGRGASTVPWQGTLGSVPPIARVAPLILFHGDRDRTVHPSNATQIVTQWTGLEAAWRDGSGREALAVTVDHDQVPGGYAFTRSVYGRPDGPSVVEQWMIHGAGHAWSGGSADGSFTDPKGPDASREMLRFFHEHPAEASGSRTAD